MKRPFLIIFISFLVGIILYNKVNIDMQLIKILLLMNIILEVAIFIFGDKKVLFNILIISLVMLLGITKRDIDMNKSEWIDLYDEQVEIIGRVQEVLKDEPEYERHLFKIEKLKNQDKIKRIDEKLIVSIYGDTELKLGDKAVLKVNIAEPKKNRNPRLFNYKEFLESKGISAVASSKEYNIKIFEKNNFNFFQTIQLKVKRHITYSLDESLNVKNSSLLKSIILGDTTYLEEDSITSFRQLGLSHILAVSGLHIGIIFAFIITILSLLKTHKRIAMIFSILIIWIYAALIGFPPSVVRASTMFSFLIIARLLHIRYDAVNILCLTGLIMLVYRTSFIFSVGFQLSFLATFTILILMPMIKNTISIKNKKLKSALIIILAAQIGVLPLSLYYFNEFQTLSVIANLIIAPLLSIGIVIGFSIVLISLLSLKLSIIFGVICNMVLNLSSLFVTILSNWSFLNLSMASPSLKEIFFYYLGIFIALKIIDIKTMDRCIMKVLYLNFIMALVFSIIVYNMDETVSLEFIDVGQGDAALVRMKNKNILIDTGGTVFGSFDVGENILLPYLKKSGVKKLDAVFLSHFDADHVKGLVPLFGEIKMKNIFIGYKNPDNLLYRELVKGAKANNVNISVINKGDILKLNKDSLIEVLHPTRDITGYENENDKSLVFLLKAFKKEILFTGDIEEKSEDDIVKNTKSRSVDIIKVPHHGSKTSSKQELIDHFNPRVAVIQLGKNNFGHPNTDVLKRYTDANTHVLRNDLSGLIHVEITKHQMKFTGFLKEKRTVDDYIKVNPSLIYVIYSGYIYVKVLKYRQLEHEKGLRC